MILAILQARVSSTRLPGKVLKPLLGRPMLARQIERLHRSRRIDSLVLATSTHSTDDPLERLAAECGVRCYRGSLEDVLDRFYQAAQTSRPLPDHLVRVTGDCPLIDPSIIDELIEFYLKEGGDLVEKAEAAPRVQFHLVGPVDGGSPAMDAGKIAAARHLPGHHAQRPGQHHPVPVRVRRFSCVLMMSHLFFLNPIP